MDVRGGRAQGEELTSPPGTWVLHTDLPLEQLNLHLAELEAAGMLGAVEQDGHASAYFPHGPVEVPVAGRWEPVADQDWAETWKAGLEPVRVGDLVVTPPWHAGGSSEEIVIEPAQAFGTGHHETTAGCLAALQQLPLGGARVLDVGCGSGVLAIAAARLGAATVVAVDTDPLAVEATEDNARVNGVTLDVRGCSAADVEGTFDVVVANLDTATLTGLAGVLAARLGPGATLVASGVSRERAEEAVTALSAAGLSPDVREGGEWVVLVSGAAHTRPRPIADPSADHVELVLDGFTHGGEAVGRLPSGKACFVGYAIPGERVRVEVVEEHKRWARARLVAVLEASPDRIEPPCPHFGPGRCGGCVLQHIAPARQAILKRQVVVDQLERIGGLADPPVDDTVTVGAFGYRNSARFAVDAGGRLGFRRAGTHDVLAIDRCPLLHPATQAVRDEAGDDWQGVQELAVRAAVTGRGAAMTVAPGADALPPLPPGATPVALRDDAGRTHALRGDPVLVERVAGFDYRVSADSFFQANTAGAEELVAQVRAGAGVEPGEAVVDLYAGVGLFSRALAADGATVVAVEGDPSACADARENLAGTTAAVVCEPVADALARIAAELRGSARPSDDRDRFSVVVLDPPRRGAGRDVCGRIATLRPRVVVYVSCDPAALARDAAALTKAGYPLVRAVPVDQFPQTAAIEVVATFARR